MPAAFAGPTPCTIVGGNVTCTGNQSAGIVGGANYPADKSDFPLNTTSTLTVTDLSRNITPSTSGSAYGIEWSLLPVSPPSVSALFSSPSYSIYASSTSGGFAAGMYLNSQGSGSGSGRNVNIGVNGSVTAIGVGGAAVYGFVSGNNGGTGNPGYAGGGLSVVLGPNDGHIQGSTDTMGIAAIGQAGNGGNGSDSSTASGGKGGKGGTGTNVNLTVSGGNWDILSAGSDAPAVLLQSTGGNGGNGGNSTFSDGGGGGTGGQGGEVSFIVKSSQGELFIRPGQNAPRSPGILLISQAGAGGTGGTGKIFGDGGSGGPGGGGGTVTLSAASLDIATSQYSADSPGVAAYSIGGSGGQGGDGGWITGHGGGGGGTGPSGAVTVTVGGGMIQTDGTRSAGIIAQSIAGHAAAGGSAIAVNFANFGADGGSAGAGGVVSVSNGATIRTNQAQSAALFAQSAGGGGGNGGSGFGIFYSQGGNGGIGGNGGSVTVTNTGSLTTSGADSDGIVAQSVGGAGGDGGMGESAVAALGGRASSGSTGGAVTVVNMGSIETGATTSLPVLGAADPECAVGCSAGILAQSIGGGGGFGGTAGGYWFSLGGTGGGGGSGGAVDVINTGDIVTRLSDSPGIAAESIGGGGGNGGGGSSGDAVAAVAIGASGGDGGNGGTVHIAPTSGMTIQTKGANSPGILADSTGGGGGDGGYASAISLGTSFSVSVALGGSGGKGGSGQDVIVDTVCCGYNGPPDTITTAGVSSDGILAQSVGGGGGNGGFAVSVSGAAKGVTIAFAMGGSGGGGGNGGPVTLTSNADIKTTGDLSSGLVAQSIGKGGGNGGLTVSGAINLTGAGVSVALGGSGGAGGSASAVSLSNAGTVITSGAEANGVVAQSIGGGGGNAGITVAASASAGGAASGNIAFALGGQGGAGVEGGPVVLNNYGPVTVTGAGSEGLLAESTGGGGGNGGLTISATLQGTNAKEVALAIGGSGATGANGGDVTLTNTAPVQTGSPGIDPLMGQNAPGIVASSAGGTGGDGGLTASLALGAGGSSVPLQASIAVGGAGLGGGDAGTVTLDNSGTVRTYADQSPALLGSSIGGGGGDAGYVLAGTGTLGGTSALGASVAVGQGGGTGGIGGIVNVTNTAELDTFGMNSDAIDAHSEGGGGGDAGAVLAFTATTAKNEVSVNLAVGGKGGKGGTGGDVTVENSGGLATTGQNSDGISADSIGGSGGNGSISLAGILSINGGYAANVSVGGGGGIGNPGGGVTVHSSGPIVTTGDQADGIFAQSTGGSGGDARTTSAVPLGTRVALSMAIGGTGGSGNNGGDVEVDNYDGITTTGAGSRGIFAQSVGGGGGASKAVTVGIDYESSPDKPLVASLGVSVGRPGASGGAGGTVMVTNTGDITTGGVYPDGISPAGVVATNESGIVAESVGGGGGNGGDALSLLPGVKGGDTTFTLSVGVGGSGGEAGTGGPVTVNNIGGTITTSDTESYGILAQSIGNGGGKGGIAMAVPGVLTSKDKSTTVNISTSVGGAGGSGNEAGVVTVDNTGSVTTHGDGSHGIFAQSIGSGGGDGGSAYTYFIGVPKRSTVTSTINASVSLGGKGGSGGNGNTVDITNSGTITTTGDDANGIEAQSIGGGGGEAGNASSLAVFPTAASANIGGYGGQSNDGGTVTITQNAGAAISTAGSNSTGIYAQSIGGGGGRGGTGVYAPIATIAVGGFGGDNGNGGAVNINIYGGTITTGTNTTGGSNSSYGIFAQSVGGGGGQAGGVGFGIIDAPYYGPAPSSIGTSLPVGTPGQSSGNGGPVTVVMNGAITTSSDNGVGIFAQSIGGGGGVAGQAGTPATCAAPCSNLVGSLGNTGSAGQVEVDLNGTITTAGQYSHGIFAQSAAGSASHAGNVTVALGTGSSVRANGANANAVWAQSVGGTNGVITVKVSTGVMVQGGSGDSSYGVHFLDGQANTLNNAGTITTLNGENGVAVRADGGSVAITDTGSIIGGVDLNGPDNAFFNAPGGYFAPGPVVVLGAGNALVNAGVVEPGGGQLIGATDLTGSFVQTPSGTLVVDLDASRHLGIAVNQLRVSGTATLAGHLQVRLLNLGPGRTGLQTAPILSADQGIQLAQFSVIPSVVGQYRLLDPPSVLTLQYDVDFAAPQALAGLNSVDAEIGDWLQHAYLSTGLPPALSYLLGAGDAAQYGALLAGLSPEAYAVNRWATTLSAMQFSNRLLTCEGDATFVRATRGPDCISFGGEGWQYQRDSSQSGADYTLNADQFSLVLQHQLNRHLRVNLGVGYGNWTAEATGKPWETTAGQLDSGIMLERQVGAAMFGAGVTGGFNSPEVSRTVLPGLTASGTQHVWYINPTLRAEYRLQFHNWYLKPQVSFNATYVSAGAVSESASRFGFSIQQQSQLFASLSPALKVGGHFSIAPGYVLHPSFSVGLLQFLSNPSPSVTAEFAGTSAVPYPLTVTSGVDRSYLDLEAGIDLVTTHNFSVGLDGFSRLSLHSHEVGGGVRIMTRF